MKMRSLAAAALLCLGMEGWNAPADAQSLVNPGCNTIVSLYPSASRGQPFSVDAFGSTCVNGTFTGTVAIVPQSLAPTSTPSGTITSGGVAQTPTTAKPRKCLAFQNLSTGDLWWRDDGGTAAATQPSKWLPAGSYYEYPAFMVPNTAISFFGATTGQAFQITECL